MVSAWGCKTALDSLTSVQVILLQEQRSIKYQSKAVISGFWKRLQACYLSCTSVFFLPYHTTPSNLESALSDDSIPPVPTLPPLDSRKVINSALIIQPFPCGPALLKSLPVFARSSDVSGRFFTAEELFQLHPTFLWVSVLGLYSLTGRWCDVFTSRDIITTCWCLFPVMYRSKSVFKCCSGNAAADRDAKVPTSIHSILGGAKIPNLAWLVQAPHEFLHVGRRVWEAGLESLRFWPRRYTAAAAEGEWWKTKIDETWNTLQGSAGENFWGITGPDIPRVCSCSGTEERNWTYVNTNQQGRAEARKEKKFSVEQLRAAMAPAIPNIRRIQA